VDDALDEEVAEVRVDVQDLLQAFQARLRVGVAAGADEFEQAGLVLGVAAIALHVGVDLADEAAVVKVPGGVLEEVFQELVVEAFFEQVGAEDPAVEEQVGVGAAGGRDEGLAGDLAGDLLAEHRAVLGEVVQLELPDAPEFLALAHLVGPDGEARPRVGDGAEAAGRALELDGALVQGHPAVLLDGAFDEVAGILVELGDVLRRDQDFDLRDEAGEQGVIGQVGGLGLGFGGDDRGDRGGLGAQGRGPGDQTAEKDAEA